MEKLKWFLFGFVTASVGFWLYRFYGKNFDKDNFMGDFEANATKEYGEIAQSIQQKQAQNYTKIDTEYKKGLAQ
mgnify:CR=1 FL=1